MAAKKMGSPKPPPGNGKKRVSQVEQAAAAIQRQYGNNLAGSKTMREAIQSLQDVVAESSLVDKYSMRTLDAASARVAKKAFTGMTQAQRKNKGKN
jgi:hypothetical protein